MSSSSDDDRPAVTLSPRWKKRRSSVKDLLGTNHRSEDITSMSNSEVLVESNVVDHRSRTRSRSVSEKEVNYKSQWASAIGAQ